MYTFLSRLTLLLVPLIALAIVVLPAANVSALDSTPVVTIMAADPPEPSVKEQKCPPGYAHPKHYDGEVSKETCCPTNVGEMNGMNCFIGKYVNPVINLLSAFVGVVIVASLIIAGIQYSAAGGDSSKVAKAKERIMNSLLALASFMFLFAFLQWVIPGGINF